MGEDRLDPFLPRVVLASNFGLLTQVIGQGCIIELSDTVRYGFGILRFYQECMLSVGNYRSDGW